MLLYFGNNMIDEIKFFAQPKAKLSPMSSVNHDDIKLKGFQWIKDKRPASRKNL